MAEASFPAGLIDTDILIDALRGTEDGLAFPTNQHASSGITAISSILMQLGYNNHR